tara:strand:- start:7 stop:141 length:135 start_codon:yes stop_codon:yes gene_type:complete
LSEINDLIWLELRPKVLGDFKRERQSQKDKKKCSAHDPMTAKLR